MTRIIAKYTAGSVLAVAFLMTATAALAEDPKKQAAKEAEPPSQQTGPGPTSSRADTTGTPGVMSEQTGKSAKQQKQQMKDCVAHTRANNTSVSEADAKKTCEEAIKAQKDNPR